MSEVKTGLTGILDLKQLKDPNTRHYIKKVPPAKVPGLLKEFCRLGSKILVWREYETEDDSESHKLLDYDDKQKRIVMQLNQNLITSLKNSAMINENCFMRIDGSLKYYFCEGLVKPGDRPNTLDFFPNIANFYISQRRRNYRLSADAEGELTIKVKINNLWYPALDVSTGGTCAVMPIPDTGEVKPGTILRELKVQIRDKVFKIPRARSANISPIKKSGDEKPTYAKIGIEFQTVPTNIEQQLFQFIKDEMKNQGFDDGE